ncbi:MAG: protein-L-isoaspartate(D-aspartate) O-methyltransferase [Pseudomonadales bacterium]|nr:protein-L-isoaspartate(D-aspartate) O-methyltransferase [Pseudomonadales bacterium]
MTSQRTRERLIQRLKDQGITDQRVLDVMRTTPRHIFLDEALSHRAYEDTALPIGYSQTISQPYVVALMTQIILSLGPRKRVLEIGAGSGYQTAVLAQLVDKVFSVERIKPLLDKARSRMRMLGFRNVRLNHSDGGFGWPEYGPYDAILSAAAPEQVPGELLLQMAPDGILVIPVGPGSVQELRVIIRKGDSMEFQESIAENVRFVPLLSGVTR